MERLNQAAFSSSAASGVELDVVSVCGPVREENQDAAAAWRGDLGAAALIVADGMGGHAAGREAAEIVVRIALEVLQDAPTDAAPDWEALLRHAFVAAQAAVQAAAATMALPGMAANDMGATAVMAVMAYDSQGPVLHVAHAGDSRAYLFRGRCLTRLTSDHSLVGQLVHDGLLREEEAFGHPDSNIIQRAVGQHAPFEPELQPPLPLVAGDLVLLSSDGLHGAVSDTEIAAVAARSGSTLETCQRLLDAALAAVSQDNITIGCMRLAVGAEPRRVTRVEAAAPIQEGGAP